MMGVVIISAFYIAAFAIEAGLRALLGVAADRMNDRTTEKAPPKRPEIRATYTCPIFLPVKREGRWSIKQSGNSTCRIECDVLPGRVLVYINLN